MKKYSKEEINGTRGYFQSQGFEEVDVTLEDLQFTYFVMPKELEPLLPDFVFRCTGDENAGYVFGISDSVDDRFRQFAVAHEYIEFTQIGMDTPKRCATALERELALVPEDIKDEYVDMRHRFFSNLIEYCQEKPDKYTPHDINEFKSSLSRLEEIMR